MTLVTQLSTSFTDTTLPILQKDPVIPNAGAVVLFDFKSTGTWPAQTSPITSYTSLVNNNWPALAPSGPHTYTAASGRVTPGGGSTPFPSFPLETAGRRLFSDLTANYCLSIWLFRPTTFTSLQFGYFAGNASQATSNSSSEHSLIIAGDQAAGITIRRPNTAWNENYVALNAPTNAVSRIGYAWAKNSGTWQHRSILNNGTSSAWINSSHGTGTDGIKDAAGWTNRIFGSYGSAGADAQLGVYRFYLENLTISGRTPEQVWAADWTRGNGRYS